MEEDGIYKEPDTAAPEPTTDVSAPVDGGGQTSSEAGGNKRDPTSSGINIGHTIAGRSTPADCTVGGSEDSGRDSSNTPETVHEPAKERETGGPDTRAQGSTGTSGRELGEGEGASKTASAEDMNPGEAETGTASGQP